MDALLPLAGVARYGDVRGTASEEILRIVDGLFERALIALPGACVSLDEQAAEEMVKSMAGVEETVKLLDRGTMREEWQGLLHRLFEHDAIHPLVRGWCCRLLLEQGALDRDELQRLAGLALSRGTPAREAASWIEGLLRGSGLLVLHEDGLWVALDGWLRQLDEETFSTTLPLLRRAFSGFQPPERRAMGEKVKRLRATEVPIHPDAVAVGKHGVSTGSPVDGRIDRERARQVLPVLAQILGGVADGDR
jgi:hypothetical protein